MSLYLPRVSAAGSGGALPQGYPGHITISKLYMIGSSSALASTLISAALSAGSLAGVPAPADVPQELRSQIVSQITTASMPDTFSCKHYRLPWCYR